MMKILQWNIWFKDCLNNLDKIIAELKRFDADICCLQEVEYINDAAHLQPLWDLYPYHYFATADTNDEGAVWGSCILSRYPIISEKKIFIQEKDTARPESYDNENRIYAECDIDVNGQVFSVGTTHSSYTHRIEETAAKDIEIEKLIDIIKMKKSNYIIAGDFNIVPASKYITRIEQYLKNLGPEYSENTWATKPFSYNGFEVSELSYRLDYIFGTSDIKLVKAEILHTNSSDHLPILVKI